ncbi:BTAD domain-containing putative transcriptional regulator [Amycolatopsis mongoliensis]|uniref:BTAD domain-containing putative transcriptional regulator n=1 Tax=Amycolatopsis mongoliensis TaxID=715475 RepID=A0A9Y2K249_9PSEU|nr:AfsR/SARP family transcriptional regulator [Amycolatopsis sp. 4-36]WIY07497.1 BTAD domain-containing putative transcriptional regulator [Amycolatopsis sp. 4-36]
MGGAEVVVGPPRQRAVLAILALRANETVSRAVLIDGVWGDAAPASVEGSVHTYVHGLRRVLSVVGGEVLVRSGGGYRLVVDPDAVDVVVAESGVRRARELAAAGDRSAAADVLRECLGLWRGVPLFGLPGPLAEAERVRLTELRVEVVEERAEWLLGLGRHREVVGELSEAVGAEPFRERLRGLLMVALYRCGRRADALAEFESARRLFVAELGLDPGAELAELQVRMLRSDPGLDVVVEPAAGSAGAVGVPAQLPHEVPGFVGRAGELEQLAQWRLSVGQGGRALVISAVDGVGGVGKTSLAVRFAREVAGEYPDGQLYVNLRGFDPHRGPLSVGEALGQLLWSLGAGGRRRGVDAQVVLYRTLLSGKRMLILLDNAVSAEQVRELLPGPSRSLVLVTSRNRLTGLVVRDGARRLTLGVLPEEEAVELLRVAAGRARVDAEPGAAVALVRLCGCLPLAVRIAAERVSSDRGVGLGELVGALAAERDRLDTLDAGDDEMSSVRGVFSWSYRSLDVGVARLFRLLGVVPGVDVGVVAVAALVDRPVEETGGLLAVLVEQNLLEQRDGRYGLHDLVRVYAAELAEREDPEEDRVAALRGLMIWYLHSVRRSFSCFMPDHPLFPAGVPDARHELPAFETRESVYAWYNTEVANILALTQCAAELGEHDIAWQLAWCMYNYYYSTGLLSEWIELLDIGLVSAEKTGRPEPQSRILTTLGVAHSRIGQNEIAVHHLERGLSLARGMGNQDLQIALLANLASTLREMKRYDEGVRRAQEAVELAMAHGTDFRKASCLDSLCELYVESGQPEEALKCGETGLQAARTSDTRLTEVNILVNMAHARRDLGDAATAMRDYQAVLELCSTLGDRYHEALALLGIAELDRRASRVDSAREHAQCALNILVQLNGEEAGVAQAFLAMLDEVA